MLLLTALAFTAVLGFALYAALRTLADNGSKILAALGGRSRGVQPVLATRPVRVRIATRRVSQPVSARPRLRAAA